MLQAPDQGRGGAAVELGPELHAAPHQVQYSTVQYSTVQYSTVLYSTDLTLPLPRHSSEVLLEVWDEAATPETFLGLGIVSISELMAAPTQRHVIPLQGRPFQVATHICKYSTIILSLFANCLYLIQLKTLHRLLLSRRRRLLLVESITFASVSQFHIHVTWEYPLA